MAALTITSGSGTGGALTPGPPGTPYSFTLAASGGSGTGYTWSLVSGALPSPAAIAFGTNAPSYSDLIGAGVTGITSAIGYAEFTVATGTTQAVSVSGPGAHWTVSGSAPLNKQPVFLTGSSIPGGFSKGSSNVYWVVNSSGSSFDLSATPGGSVVSPTSSGSGTLTPFTGVPASWPGASASVLNVVDVPIMNFKPVIPLVNSGALDTALTTYFSGAPNGAIIMPYHEANNQTSAYYTPAQLQAADLHMLALAHAANPTLKLYRGVACLTGGTNVEQWIWGGVDGYGVDFYQKTGIGETPSDVADNAVTTMQAAGPGLPIAIIETNTPNDITQWWTQVVTYAKANGIQRVQSYWAIPGDVGTGGQVWQNSFASEMNTVTADLAAGVSLSPAGLISGTPEVDGTYTFTVMVTDSALNTATATLSITITPSTSGTTWSNSYAASESFTLPPPGDASCAVQVANTAGDWMFAIVTWRQPAGGDEVTVTVADDAHNWWEPVGAPTADSPHSGVTRTAVWAAPAARAANFVMAAPTGFVTALAVQVIDVPGLDPWLKPLTTQSGKTNAGTSLSLSHGAPSAQAFLIAAAGTDNNSDTVTGPGAGWTALPPVTASNGTDHTADLTLTAGWQLATGATSAAWSSTGSLDMSGVLAGVLVSADAPVQANSAWPVVITEIAPGSGAATPPSEIGWTDASAYQRALTFTQGRQYTLGQLQAGQGTITFDNQGAPFLPPGSGSFAGIDSGTPGRVRLINPAALCPHNVIWNGFFQRWPPGWDDAVRGITQATITDAWAYVNATLPSILRAEIQNDAPYAYWPLSDSVQTTQASNIAQGGSGLPLNLVTSKFGTTNASKAFGANSGALPGDTTVVVTTSGQTSSASGMFSETLSGSALTTNANGYTLQCADPNFPPISAGVTIECWIQSMNAAPNWDPGIWIIKDGRGPVLKLQINQTNGNLELAWWNNQGVGKPNITVSAAFDYRNFAELVHVAVAVNQSSWTVYVDGGGFDKQSGSFSGSGLRPTFSLISFNGEADRFYTGNFWTGYVAHAAITPVLLPQVRVLTHWFAGVFAITDDNASGRIDRLMQAATWTGRRCLLPESGPDIDQTVSASDIGGQPAATALTNIAASTIPAVLAVVPTGDVFYLAKQYAYNQPIKWTLGTNADSGEIPFLPLGASSGLDYDPSRVVDDIQLTHLDRQDVILPSGQGATAAMASLVKYGDITYWVTGYLDGDATKSYTYGPGLYDLANWLSLVFGSPRLRVAKVTVEASANEAGLAAWELYGAAAVGDMVQFNYRPVTDAPLVVAVTGRISQTARTLKFGEDGNVTAAIDLVIDPAPEANALTCDDAVRGQLNGANVLAW